MGCGQSKNDIRKEYRLGRILGRGAFGQVRECIHRQSREIRAVKIMNLDSAKTKSTSKWHPLNMFEREVNYLLSLDHVNIVKLYNVFDDGLSVFGVMEKLDGGELFSHISALQTFTEDDAAKICKQMLEATAYIHSRNIIHRDIKGENFLFSSSQKNSTLKMIDFGIATYIKEGEILEEQCGTLHYLAPEMLRHSYGKEVDIWAIGVIMYLMFYGKFPFRGEDRNSILKEIENYKIDWRMQDVNLSSTVTDFLSKLLERNPHKRLTAVEALRHPFIVNNTSSIPGKKKSERIIPRHVIEAAGKIEGEAIVKGRRENIQELNNEATPAKNAHHHGNANGANAVTNKHPPAGKSATVKKPNHPALPNQISV